MTFPQRLLEAASVVVGGLLVAAFFLTFFRLVRGPRLTDRVVALDLLALLAVAVIAVYDVAVEQPVLLDIAMVLALVAFLGTVAFAHYLGRRAGDA
jgi:multicomponent Na+:H+ antiporter subunit F